MQRKDFYVILGVPRDESEVGIRGAFRDLVKHHRPGGAGGGPLPSIDAIIEAYHVLSDHTRRAAYDRSLDEPAAEPSSAGLPSAPGSRPSQPRSPVEPLVPEPVSLKRDFEVTRPSLDAVLDRIRSNFVPHERAPRGLDALRLEVSIGSEQATNGGELVLSVPVFTTCPRCRGAGSAMATYRCAACGGSGQLEEERPARLRIPPGVDDGTLYQLPLDGLGIRNLYLEVRVRVRG